MPCYEVNLMTVEFLLKNIDYLREAISALGWSVQEEGSKLYVKTNYKSFVIDLETSTLESNRGTQGLVNQLKRAYSSKVIAATAKKKRWVMKQTSATIGTLRKY